MASNTSRAGPGAVLAAALGSMVAWVEGDVLPAMARISADFREFNLRPGS